MPFSTTLGHMKTLLAGHPIYFPSWEEAELAHEACGLPVHIDIAEGGFVLRPEG